MNLEERIRQLRQAKTQIPGILARAGMNAALRAVEKAVEETPPTVNSLRGTNTRTGEMKQHWVTDSRPRPVRQGDSYVSELNNDKQYASFVNDGHRMKRHFVPGLYINPESGLLEYDPSAKVGIVVGTKTRYVKGEFMVDKAKKAYQEVLLDELDKEIQRRLK